MTAPATAIVSRLSLVRRRTNVGGTSATMAPTPSSQARVKVEKYADGGDATVAWIDQASEATVRMTSIVSTALRGSRSTRRPLPLRSHAVTARQPASSSGQST